MVRMRSIRVRMRVRVVWVRVVRGDEGMGQG